MHRDTAGLHWTTGPGDGLGRVNEGANEMKTRYGDKKDSRMALRYIGRNYTNPA
jgi:hypothetical protein